MNKLEIGTEVIFEKDGNTITGTIMGFGETKLRIDYLEATKKLFRKIKKTRTIFKQRHEVEVFSMIDKGEESRLQYLNRLIKQTEEREKIMAYKQQEVVENALKKMCKTIERIANKREDYICYYDDYVVVKCNDKRTKKPTLYAAIRDIQGLDPSSKKTDDIQKLEKALKNQVDTFNKERKKIQQTRKS